jgi:hypothetical protein
MSQASQITESVLDDSESESDDDSGDENNNAIEAIGLDPVLQALPPGELKKPSKSLRLQLAMVHLTYTGFLNKDHSLTFLVNKFKIPATVSSSTVSIAKQGRPATDIHMHIQSITRNWTSKTPRSSIL